MELSKVLRQNALVVFDSLSFVKDKILVLKTGELSFLSHNCFEGGQDYIKLALA